MIFPTPISNSNVAGKAFDANEQQIECAKGLRDFRRKIRKAFFYLIWIKNNSFPKKEQPKGFRDFRKSGACVRAWVGAACGGAGSSKKKKISHGITNSDFANVAFIF